MSYDVIESVPMEFRVFLLDTMSRLKDIYEIKRQEVPESQRAQEFTRQLWLGKVRAMFGVSNGHAYLKQAMVSPLLTIKNM